MAKWIICPMFIVMQSCVPDIYLIDRQTVFESEASGQWPELDQIFYKNAAAKGPLKIENNKPSTSKKGVYGTLHSDQIDLDKR